MKISKLLPALVLLSGSAFAQVIPINFNPGDTVSYDGWRNLTNVNFPGYSGFPGFSGWPGPIGSNAAGSGDANLNKVGNGPGGGPYVGGESIYFGGTSNVPNTLGGTLSVTDSTIISDLNTVVFQIQIGEAFGYDLYNGAPPTLMVNGSTPITLQYSGLIAHVDTGTTFPTPDGPEIVYLNTWGFQYDLSGISEPITSLTIQFSGVQHSQVYALQLNQSSGIYSNSLVPEPSTALLGCFGLGLALVSRRRRKVAE
jgi:hypothetical protein